MSNELALTLIPGAPLAAAIWIAVVHQMIFRGKAHIPCVAGAAISAAASLWLLFVGLPETYGSGDHGHAQAAVTVLYDWFSAGTLHVPVELRADALTALMLGMVTSVALLVAIFAVGYMHDDPGYPRFFGAISLFIFSMCMLVLAGNFLLLFVFWEAVGLCSYLLIGYWFHKPSAAAAAKKAFVVNRIGDFGLMLGVFLIWQTFGTLSFEHILADPSVIHSAAETKPAGTISLICLLLFVGAVGKSAQFPLHVWLPDAMEGPTPVSALIHAATMVTAGVYLVARCTPFFSVAPTVQMIVSGTGAVTAIVAAITALTQYDLKRVLAFSTVSQLGFMFMSLGAGAGDAHLLPHAVTFGLFHMFTHAFFKAALFLSAGSVMHSMGDCIDMREFGGLRKLMPVTHFAFLSGALALAGFPLLSGFWSKDEILAALWAAAQDPERGRFYAGVLSVALVTSLLTAFYTFRAYFLTFAGPERLPKHVHHPHDCGPEMAGPLVLLGIGSLVVGLLTGPTHWYAGVLHQTPGFPHAEAHAMSIPMMIASVLLAVAGIGAAWALYGASPQSARLADDEITGPRALSYRGLWLDPLFACLVVKPVQMIAEMSQRLDRWLLDKIVDGFGLAPGLIATVAQPLQNGRVQGYGVVMLLAAVVSVAMMLGAVRVN